MTAEQDSKHQDRVSMDAIQITGVDPGSDQVYDITHDKDVDVAVKILKTAHHEGPISQEEMDAVRWKIDWHMVPMLFVCLQLSGWDKVV